MTVAEVLRADVPYVVEATGTVEPVRTAAVEAQVGGLVTRVAFREGDDVRQGQTLFEIDPRPYDAALAQAQANLARDHALWDMAQREYERTRELAEQDYVTRQQLEQAEATLRSRAATLAADSAAMQQARLDRQFATVRAPIAGRTGALLVREGNVVRPQAGTPLVVVNQLAPIRVRFSVPATYLADVRRRAGQELAVRALPVGDSSTTREGVLSFIDNAVDSLSGTVNLKATFANRDLALWPGSLVRLGLELDVERGVLVVPRAAVLSGQAGDVVYVVNDSRKAALRKVTVRRTTDVVAVLASGVSAGERVVTDGQLRLTGGSTVTIKGASEGAR